MVNIWRRKSCHYEPCKRLLTNWGRIPNAWLWMNLMKKNIGMEIRYFVWQFLDLSHNWAFITMLLAFCEAKLQTWLQSAFLRHCTIKVVTQTTKCAYLLKAHYLGKGFHVKKWRIIKMFGVVMLYFLPMVSPKSGLWSSLSQRPSINITHWTLPMDSWPCKDLSGSIMPITNESSGLARHSSIVKRDRILWFDTKSW